MSAEILRKAAALMRERASAATDGPWASSIVDSLPIVFDARAIPEPVVYDQELRPGNAEHIASWHPAAALAVADWLDSQADLWGHPGYIDSVFAIHPATTVARTYLGESA